MNNNQVEKFFRTVVVMLALVILPMLSISVTAGDRDKGDYRYSKHYGHANQGYDKSHGKHDYRKHYGYKKHRKDGDDRRHRGGKKYYMKKVIRSYVATGLNDYLGKPVFDFGSPYGPFGFTSVGVYNEYGTEPLPLTEDTPDSAILATSVHPSFLALARKSRADVKPEWENIPLRDVPVNVDFAFTERRALPGVLEAGPLDPAQPEPAYPITLGQWKKGRGILEILCESPERATYKITVRDLIPNRMYSIGATLGGPFLAPFTIGGPPNLIITDKHGDGEIERIIRFCPLDPESAPRPVFVFNVAYHSAAQNFGAVPEPVFVDNYWLGTVTHNHLQFPINVEKLDD